MLAERGVYREKFCVRSAEKLLRAFTTVLSIFHMRQMPDWNPSTHGRTHSANELVCVAKKAPTSSPDILLSVKGAIVDISAHIPKPTFRNDNSTHTAVIGFSGTTEAKNEHKTDPHKNVCASFEYSVFFSLCRYSSSFQYNLQARMRLR